MSKPNNASIASSLLLVVLLWGGNNVGTKWLVGAWPPIWTGCTRFLCAGTILFSVLKFTRWLGEFKPLTRELRGQLWWRGGLSLAAYVVAFCWALKLTAASHVALYIGASPVWSLLIEERPQKSWSSFRRYGAALLALSGVLVLFWPALKNASFNFVGELCGLVSSLLWANYNHQSRILARNLSGFEVAASSMWMSGVILLPLGLWEIHARGLVLDAPHLEVQSVNILFGAVLPYALWNSALCHWQTSRVMLFNNVIPLSTAIWAYYCLGEPITSTFCAAMILIIAGVLLGQMDWPKIFRLPEGF